jgi:RNA polymerase sporulation-specific sigma factor
MINREKEIELISDIILDSKTSSESADDLIIMYTPLLSRLVSDAIGLFPWAKVYREDLLQEARISFYKLIFLYDDSKEVKFSTFVYFCLRRSIRGNIKQYYRRYPETFCAEYSEQYEIGARINKGSIDYQTPEYLFKYNLSKDKYNQFISELSELNLNIFNLYLEDYTYKEIAGKLNINYKKVDNVIAATKRNLKAQIIDLL